MATAKQKEVSSTKVNKAKSAKPAVKQVKTTVPVFVYPNKGKNELDEVLININGKDQWFKALSEHKLDISSLKLNDLVKQFYGGLSNMQLSGFRFVYKRVYGIAFGFGIDRQTSYKCLLAHHTANGHRALVLNQTGLTTIEQIDSALDKQGLSAEKAATYRVVHLTKENISKVTKAAIQLLKLKAIG